MKINKSLMLAGIITTVVAGTLVSATGAQAQGTDTKSSIIDKIAERFSLNRDDVQSVFDDQRKEDHAAMEEQRSERLQELVDNGTITQEQYDALQAKHDEMEAAREALKDQDLSQEEMHQKMEELQSSFESWAEEQGIDLSVIRPERDARQDGPGGHHGMHDMVDEYEAQ